MGMLKVLIVIALWAQTGSVMGGAWPSGGAGGYGGFFGTLSFVAGAGLLSLLIGRGHISLFQFQNIGRAI